MKMERVETEINEVRTMELKAQMFKAETDRSRHRWRDNAVKSGIDEL